MKSKAFLAVVVALAMLISFGVAVKDAKADAILFPWVVKSNSVSTLVSVVNTAGTPMPGDYDSVLHYQYWYKRTTANGQAEICDPVSFKRPTSKDDIVTFDAAGNINGGKALFNDPSPYGGQSFKLNAEAPRRAFLIVDNNTPGIGSRGLNVDGTLYGEAIVLELAGGAAWGYIAYNADGGAATTQSTEVFFNDGLDLQGEVIDWVTVDGIEWTQTTILPPSIATTKFFVTPVETDMTGICRGQRCGTANARVQLFVMDPSGYWYGGIYDNDENIIDFDRRKNIVCTSADDLKAFMTEAAYNQFTDTNGQGWAYIWTWPGNDVIANNSETGVIIGKLEYTTSGMAIDGKTIPGTFNNFVWLRNNASIVGCGGNNCIQNITPDDVVTAE